MYKKAQNFFEKHLALREQAFKSNVAKKTVLLELEKKQIFSELSKKYGYNKTGQFIPVERQEWQNISATLVEFYRENKFQKALEFLVGYILREPDEYWLFTIASEAFWNVEDYKSALLFSRFAYDFSPGDPLVIENHATALYYNKNYKRALQLWNTFIDNGLNWIINHPNSEGSKWSKSLYIDSYYNAGLCYEKLGNFQKAEKFLEHHLNLRQAGIASRVNKKQVQKLITGMKTSLIEIF